MGTQGFMGAAAFICCGAYLLILIGAAWTDWKTRRIDNVFFLMILALGAAAVRLFPEHTILDRGIGFLAVSVPMLVLTVLIPGAFGGGDIKLMAASGWFLGWRAVVCAMVIALFGSGVYGGWMLAKGKMGRKDSFALGPFLAAGLAIALFLGDQVLERYI
ncbi:MAG: prepilin peptidase [Clostridiales bacterium]|nr:prepilin peptidase [Clostridiales bacterium]